MKSIAGQIVLAGAWVALLGCSYVADQDLDTGYAVILNDAGDEAGRAEFEKSEAGVQFELTVSGLEPGSYGVQIRGEGNCSGPGFAAAGAPVMEAAREEQADAVAATDEYLAQFEVTGTGVESSSFTAAGITFRPGPNSLFAPGGTAILIEKLNPAETYGKPVACGVISRTKSGESSASLPPGRLESAESADNLGTGDDKTFRQPQ